MHNEKENFEGPELPTITHEQKKALDDFFYSDNPEQVTEQLNEMFRSFVEDPSIHCTALPAVMTDIAEKNLLINELRKLLGALYNKVS